jgi:HNH endonuclease
MTLSPDLREYVRQRASCACEFCGVSEIDVGGMLTLDHFQPRSQGGADTVENLVYACANCNQYKQGYWSDDASAPQLWNPRQEPFSTHFIELEDGQLLPLTPVGTFTCKRLRLNRPPLIAYRLQLRRQAETVHSLARYRNLVLLLTQLNRQLSDLVVEQQTLLQEQHNLLQALLRQQQDR